ncbi:MAG: hypothetical protein NTY77_20045 [Elusimicrobia bacterium]|nr:hypothetical protein [Elusimicrobiota bacterium]
MSPHRRLPPLFAALVGLVLLSGPAGAVADPIAAAAAVDSARGRIKVVESAAGSLNQGRYAEKAHKDASSALYSLSGELSSFHPPAGLYPACDEPALKALIKSVAQAADSERLFWQQRGPESKTRLGADFKEALSAFRKAFPETGAYGKPGAADPLSVSHAKELGRTEQVVGSFKIDCRSFDNSGHCADTGASPAGAGFARRDPAVTASAQPVKKPLVGQVPAPDQPSSNGAAFLAGMGDAVKEQFGTAKGLLLNLASILAGLGLTLVSSLLTGGAAAIWKVVSIILALVLSAALVYSLTKAAYGAIKHLLQAESAEERAKAWQEVGKFVGSLLILGLMVLAGVAIGKFKLGAKAQVSSEEATAMVKGAPALRGKLGIKTAAAAEKPSAGKLAAEEIVVPNRGLSPQTVSFIEREAAKLGAPCR